eukprot:5165169-Amphidinium_carterae.1
MPVHTERMCIRSRTQAYDRVDASVLDRIAVLAQMCFRDTSPQIHPINGKRTNMQNGGKKWKKNCYNFYFGCIFFIVE